MGYDASCEMRIDGRLGRGTVLLEQKALMVRGDVRLTIPLTGITTATAADGWLRIRFDNRDAAFALGPHAARWAQRILHPPSRLDKLGVKPGMRVRVAGHVERDFVDELRGAGATVVMRDGGAPADLVFYGVGRREDLGALADLAGVIASNGAVWTIRPKGQRTITEADTMAAGKAAGLVDVKVVSFSDTLTAEKFVIPVKRRPRTDGARSARTARPGKDTAAQSRAAVKGASGPSRRAVKAS
jgi:hypothetical protein